MNTSGVVGVYMRVLSLLSFLLYECFHDVSIVDYLGGFCERMGGSPTQMVI